MADVMVVAIFLSNLGFNGVLKDQFARLHGAGEGVEVLTTAASNLLPGFFCLLWFCAFEPLALSPRSCVGRVGVIGCGPCAPIIERGGCSRLP